MPLPRIGDWITRKDADPEKLLLEIEDTEYQRRDQTTPERYYLAKIMRSADRSELNVSAIISKEEMRRDYRTLGDDPTECEEAYQRLTQALKRGYAMDEATAALTIVRVTDLKIALRE